MIKTKIGNSVFNVSDVNINYTGYDDFLIKALANELEGEITFPPYITKIDASGSAAWFIYQNRKITSIIIPNTVAIYKILRIQDLPNITKVKCNSSSTTLPNDFTFKCPLLEKVIIESDCGLLSTPSYMCELNVTQYALVLKPNRLITCGNQNIFANSTQFITAGGTGRIYVPRALLSQYQAHSSWANFSDRFLAMEDYPEICEL